MDFKKKEIYLKKRLESKDINLYLHPHSRNGCGEILTW